MKVDDDTFINLPKLYHLITEESKYKNEKNLLLGHCFCNRPLPFKVSIVSNIRIISDSGFIRLFTLRDGYPR